MSHLAWAGERRDHLPLPTKAADWRGGQTPALRMATRLSHCRTDGRAANKQRRAGAWAEAVCRLPTLQLQWAEGRLFTTSWTVRGWKGRLPGSLHATLY